MKIKFISAITACLLAFQSAAFAAFQLGTSANELTVSGTAEPYSKVSFMLLDSDSMGFENAEDTVNAYYEMADEGVTFSTSQIFFYKNLITGADGKWSYTLPMTGIETKDLTLVSNTEALEYIQYASVGFRTNMIPELKAAAASDTDTLESKISYYIGYIADRAKQYKSLSNKNKVAKYSKEVISGLDPSSETALDTLKTVVDNAVLVCGVSEGDSIDFDEAMSIVSYDTEEKANISDMGKEKLLTLFKKGAYTSIADYQEKAKVQFALQLFNYNVNQNSDNLLEVLEENNDVLELDFTKLYNLKEVNQPKAAKELAGKLSESVEEAQDNLDDIADELKKKEDGGSEGGGGGGGIGSSTTINENLAHNSSASASISNEYLEEKKYIYPDMKDASWAADAIIYLNQEGIVSGYEDNTFRPLNPITRAEFTKLVVLVFFKNKTFEFSGNFKDLGSDEWYSEYVNAAYNMGIVSGDENGYFNPDKTISRQDMAVIIYNAGKQFGIFDDVKEISKFSDDSGISDYAKTAVYALRSKSIINGVGDNAFAPKANADRASAAKILYELMINSVE